MSAADEKCAGCGKGGDGLKTCNGCKLVKYCDSTCQKAHRPMHKKECKKRASELHDEALFKQPPPTDECPICLVPLPLLESANVYHSCCGKTICCGCVFAMITEDLHCLCPFCRAPSHTSDGELIESLKKRVEANDAEAMRNLASYYYQGDLGLPQDYDMAMELCHRAGELGCARSYYNIAELYRSGVGVERDLKKAKDYYELATMRGNAFARYNLGCIEGMSGNGDRAMKHWMIAAGAGDDKSLETIRENFLKGHATKDDFEKALRAHKEAKLDEETA